MTFLTVVWLVLPVIWLLLGYLLAALIITIPVALMPLGKQIMVTQ